VGQGPRIQFDAWDSEAFGYTLLAYSHSCIARAAAELIFWLFPFSKSADFADMLQRFQSTIVDAIYFQLLRTAIDV
jgi:hypothetical protein